MRLFINIEINYLSKKCSKIVYFDKNILNKLYTNVITRGQYRSDLEIQIVYI